MEIELPQPPATTAQLRGSPLRKIFLVSSIAIGIQFLWALQLSLLTPYIQLLGISHKWSSYIWLAGPTAGMVVQPTVGYYSDKSDSRFGRRRHYMAVGTAFLVVAVLLICFAADIGYAIGDSLGNSAKPRAIFAFVIGFSMLHVSNNILQGPGRAFLGDLCGTNSSKLRIANASYAFFLSVGSILGSAASSYNKLFKIFPFTITKACGVYCANFKTCFFLSLIILIILTILVLTLVEEDKNPLKSEAKNTHNLRTRTKIPFFLAEILSAMRDLQRPMWILLLVTFLNGFAWHPFRLYSTDWMGSQIYGGKVGEGKLYEQGVHVGSLGLMIQAIMVAITSLGVDFLAHRLRGGVNKLWGGSNILLAFCLCSMVLITNLAESTRRYTTMNDGKVTPLPPHAGVKVGVWILFGVMGFPQAITASIPYALGSIYSTKSKTGQGLSVGIINLAIVIPQMLVSILSGPWDALFGVGNLPSIIVGSFFAVASGLVAFGFLPSPVEKTSTTPFDTNQ